jgi:hypothetical protein
MKTPVCCALLLCLLAACAPSSDVSVLPTRAVLPTATLAPPTALPPTATLTDTPAPTDTPELTFTPSATHTPTSTPVPPTDAPSETPTASETPAPTISLTPSLTITNTVTPTLTVTPSPSPDLGPLGPLALFAAQVTVVPFPPPTQTAIAVARAQLQTATMSALMATNFLPFPTAPGSGGLPAGELPIAPIPTVLGGGCPVAPPGSVAAIQSQVPAVGGSLGCVNGSVISLIGAFQPFERGVMIYVQTTPASIYALTQDGRFRRYDDTWVSGVDPDAGVMSPPPGLVEPIRGFGKVWRSNPDLQASLGWATAGEGGQNASLITFTSGRMIYLSAQNQTFVLLDDAPFAGGGRWQAVNGGF